MEHEDPSLKLKKKYSKERQTENILQGKQATCHELIAEMRRDHFEQWREIKRKRNCSYKCLQGLVGLSTYQ